jgi:hypothetical protein
MIRRLLWRLYRVRPVSTLVLCLPGALLVAWYGWLAFAKLHRYQVAVGEQGPLSPELYQIALHDTLMSDWRRVTMPPAPDESSLHTFRLLLERNEWGELMDSAAVRDDRPYVRGKVEDVTKGEIIEARVRLRGGRHWHLGETQKSFKLKADKGDLIAGNRVANLINDPTPMVVGEQLIIDLAKESGILTPAAYFARLQVNTKDLGVYHYEAGADESLLRDAHRIPGSIYSGELPGNAATEALWAGPELWTKVASRTDDEADKVNFAELGQFLKHVREDSATAFADFADNELDVRKFALMDVLDVAFGGDQHDFRENHQYYLDPYRGRWEPIAWNFRGFQSDRHFNIVDNPILLRLKYLPGYLTLRDRLLYEFLSGEGSPDQIHKRASKLLKKLAGELKSDPYFDAYRQLPRVDTFMRRMVRPMTLKRLALVAESELVTYNNRHAELMGALEKNPLYLQMGAPVARPAAAALPAVATATTPSANGPTEATVEATTQPAPVAKKAAAKSKAAKTEPVTPPVPASRYLTPVSLIIDGEAGAELRELAVEFAADCRAPEPALLRNLNPKAEALSDSWSPVAARSAKGQIELLTPLTLTPGVRIIDHERPNPRRGNIRSEVIPEQYAFALESSCAPLSVVAEARNTATGARILSRPVTPETLTRLPKGYAKASDTPRFTAGEVAPHHWEYAEVTATEVKLGPGDVEIPTTRVFDETESVTIEPGTRLRMGPDASLVFLGKVKFRGVADAPIILEPLTDKPWGGVAIQGEATTGSRLRHVIAQGGSEPVHRAVSYPAMLNVHSTSDIDIEDCRFGKHTGKTDLLHAAYVKDLRITDTQVRDVGGDAIDLEFTTAKLKRLRVVNAGDDALDLMGTEVDLSDSVLLGMEGNGVSAGEESAVTIRNSLIADAKIGVQAKNASEITLSGTILLNNNTGVRTYQKTVRYDGESRVSANVLFVVGATKHAIKRSDRDDEEEAKLDEGRILQALPQSGVLDHVLSNVLQLSNWQDLEGWVKSARRESPSWR